MLGTLRPRQIILFLFIVLGPLGIAAWLGLEVARDEQAVSRHQFQSLLEGRLRDVDSTIAGVVGTVERQLLERIIPADIVNIDASSMAGAGPVAGVEASPEAMPEMILDELRQIRRREPLVREVFVVDRHGVLVFPPTGDAASAAELAFRDRTASIWRGQAVLYEPPVPESTQMPADGQLAGIPPRPAAGESRLERSGEPERPLREPPRGRGDTVIALARTHEQGWIAWYWEEGLHLLFWRRVGAGVIGVEIERVALLARVIASLPAAELDDGRVLLVDSRGEPMHQWGPYEPAAGEQPVAAAWVSYPLSSWRLLHVVSPAQRQAFLGTTLRLNLILGLAAVGLALLAMAFYFYRDYAGKMRDAAQRVSFVTQVSHELKTPLTNIRLYAELIDSSLAPYDDEGGNGNDGTRHRLAVIIAESERLTRLINNILTFSKQRRSGLQLSKCSIDIDELVAAVLAQFAPSLAARDIECVHTAGARQPVHADADAVGQIVANLISNVEKYAAAGKHLAIVTESRGNLTVVRVRDRGPGIAPGHRDKIFRPFYRVSDKLADGVTGTGIGLSIAHELARLSGGELVLVPSEDGACFELRIVSEEQTANESAGS